MLHTKISYFCGLAFREFFFVIIVNMKVKYMLT